MAGEMEAVDALGRTLKVLDADLHAARKKEIRGIAVLSCLIVFVLTYMTWLYIQLGKLDASVLAGVAGARVAQSLPEMQSRLKDELVRMAPDLMSEAETFILKAPARLRADIETRIADEARKHVRKFEDDLDHHLTENLQKSIDLLKQADPNVAPEKALDLLLARVRDDYRVNLITHIDGMHADSKAQMDRLHDYLTRLQKGDSLTEREKLDKEIIQAWVILVEKHNYTTPSVK